ncbi:hypothetical protein DSM112329_03312 [Paraconexibacter sp. AEG42_29]|uniref:WD40 repeat domain-containing protein n=1 Tax=Paraconexibacter sp. AEG42_29 TaxID=2997339 RepID=A0AAU7AXJ3_9ACTN
MLRTVARPPLRDLPPGRRPLRLAASALAAVAIATTLAAPAPAAADSFAYRDGEDVVVVNADGGRSRLAVDGAPDRVASAPVVDPAGNVTAIITNGKFSRPLLHWVSSDGKQVVENLLPQVGGSGLNAGPLSTSIDPTGKLFAYTYLEYRGTDVSYRPHLAIVDPTAPGLPVSPAIDRAGYSGVDWFGDRLLASDATGLYAERPGPERLQFDPWPLADGLTSVDLAADGRRAVVGSGNAQFVVETDAGGPPTASVTGFCTLPDDGRDLYRGGAPSAALSPDGTRVAYAGQSGLHVARLGAVTGEGRPCPLEDVRLVSARGGLPTSSTYTVPAPAPAPGTGPGTGTGDPAKPGGDAGPAKPAGDPDRPAPGQAPTKPAVRRPTLTKLVRSGSRVTATITCPVRCNYSVRLVRGARTLATRKGTAKAGRPLRLTLTGAKGKGLTLRLTVAGRTVARKVA